MAKKKPKKTSFLITNAFSRGTALAVIAALTLDKTWQVIIRPYKAGEGITDAQRRLYWMILTDMAWTDVNELAGHTKDQWHLKMKRKYLVRIYAREFRGYEEMCELIRHEVDEKKRKVMVRFVANETSIARKCEDDPVTGEKAEGKMIRIMREYIDYVMNYARSHGILLRIDAKVFAEAMGYEYQNYWRKAA